MEVLVSTFHSTLCLQEWNNLCSVCLQQLVISVLRCGVWSPSVDACSSPAARVLRVSVPLPQHLLCLCCHRSCGSRSPSHLDGSGCNISTSVFSLHFSHVCRAFYWPIIPTQKPSQEIQEYFGPWTCPQGSLEISLLSSCLMGRKILIRIHEWPWEQFWPLFR